MFLRLLFAASHQAVSRGLSHGSPIINQIQHNLRNDTVVWSAQADQLGYFDAVCATSWATAHSDLVVRFLKALIPAENFIVNHKDQAMTIVANTMNYTGAYLKSVWSNYQFSVTLDQSQISAMQDESRWLISNNLTKATSLPNFLNFIYSDGLKSVDPNSVNIIG